MVRKATITMLSQKGALFMYLLGLIAMGIVMYFTWRFGEVVLKVVLTCLFTPIAILYVYLFITTVQYIKKGIK